MRIIITKKGEILIKENVPQLKLPLINQNNINNKKYYLKNNLSTITKNENDIFPTINKEKNYKEIKLSPNNLNLPINMEEKYYDQKYDEEYNNNSNIIETSFNNSSTLKKNYYLKEILSEQNQKRFINKINFNKKVNFEDVNLINYLKSNRPISPRLIKKVSNSNEEELNKLDKICQKHYHNESNRVLMNDIIKKKVRWRYQKESEQYKNNLKNMFISLDNYNNLYKKLKEKEESYFSGKKFLIKNIEI
jgi:hypothetical protein